MKTSKQFLTGLIVALFAMPSVFAQNALNFDGVDDMVQTSYPGITGSAPRTIETWINTNSAVASQHVILDYGFFGSSSFDNGKRFTLNLNASHMLRLEVRGWGINGTTALNDGNWHHVATTFDGTTVKLFVDGVEEASGTPSVTVNTTAVTDVIIGSRVDVVKFFDGAIDEVRIWDYARSTTEIANNMNNEYCGAVTGLVAYHQFNQGIAGGTNTTESTSIDGSGLGNDGTLNGFTLAGATSNWVAGQALAPGSVLNQLTLSECDGFEITVGNNTYNSTGMYDDTLVGASVAGCDSIVVLDLTILSGTSSSQTISECGGYTVTVGNNTYSSTGIYIDTLAAINGCDSIVTTDLTVNVSNVTTSVSLSTITVAETGAVYQWLDCNDSYAEITGETSQSFTTTINGDYAVAVTIGNCTDTSACENISNVGIEENIIASVNLKPNPTFGIVQVEVFDFTGKITINVLDITGKQYVNAVYFNNVVELDLGYLNNGVYFVQIIDGRKSQIIKLIKL